MKSNLSSHYRQECTFFLTSSEKKTHSCTCRTNLDMKCIAMYLGEIREDVVLPCAYLLCRIIRILCSGN